MAPEIAMVPMEDPRALAAAIISICNATKTKSTAPKKAWESLTFIAWWMSTVGYSENLAHRRHQAHHAESCEHDIFQAARSPSPSNM